MNGGTRRAQRCAIPQSLNPGRIVSERRRFTFLRFEQMVNRYIEPLDFAPTDIRAEKR